MKYLPININLEKKPVLVIGGGTVALRKITTLLSVGANITCVALSFHKDLTVLSEQNTIKTINHDLSDISLLDDFINTTLIISATGDQQINEQIYQFGQFHNILVNTVDHQELCNFITPAIVDRSPVVVAISTEGAAPILARIIKQKIEYLLPLNLGKLASRARSMRKYIKNKIKSFKDRKIFWGKYFQWAHASQDVISQEYETPSDQQIEKMITESIQLSGLVSMVGAGPGNPELLTIKAIKVLQTADVVLHDHLISPEIMAMIRKDAELIDVGKQAGHHKTKQHHINNLLIKHAQQGLHVCRLKGGDSFVFGRGGEEVLMLKKHQIKFEIIPGITAAVGCAAFAGIPLTHRAHAQSLAFITAHCSDSIDTLDWQFYAKENQTLAVYMGLIKAELLVNKLITHGKSSHEHVAIIENGSLDTQRTITGRLSELPDMIIDHQVKSPALIVIGAVAQYAQQLDWFKPIENPVKHTSNLTYLKSA